MRRREYKKMTTWGLFKAQVLGPNGPWKGLKEVEFTTLEWVD